MNIKKMLADGMARYIFQREGVQPKPPRTNSKHAGGKRKPKGWRQARKKARKQARVARRRNRG